MVLILEVPLASIAIVISAVSWKTMRAIKHLSVGKSFWIPVLTSGMFFFVGSMLAILDDFGFSFTAYTAEAISASRLLALCLLAGGVYTYSRKITKNLVEQLIPPVNAVETDFIEEAETPNSIIEQLDEKPPEHNVNCKHQLGYLRTRPRRAPLPEECSGCHEIIDCKFSIVKKAKNISDTTSSTKANPEMMVPYASLEEEISNRSR